MLREGRQIWLDEHEFAQRADLAGERAFVGQLAFDRNDILFIANDRLSAPNVDDTYGRLSGEVEQVFRNVLGNDVRVTTKQDDMRDRATVGISAG